MRCANAAHGVWLGKLLASAGGSRLISFLRPSHQCQDDEQHVEGHNQRHHNQEDDVLNRAISPFAHEFLAVRIAHERDHGKRNADGKHHLTNHQKVTSTALGMEDAEKRVQEAGVQASWDEDTRQNYAQWDADGGTYKIWLEDSQSLEEKLKLIKKNDLAGVAEWRLGWENSGVWDLISQYIN